MLTSSFSPGTQIVRSGVPYVVDSSGPRGVAIRPMNPEVAHLVVSAAQLAEELRSGASRVDDLFGEQAAEEATAAEPIPKGMSEYSPEARKVAATRKKFLQEICPTGRLRCSRRQLASALRQAWLSLPKDEQGKLPPSMSSFYEWRRDWINSGFSDLSLLPRWDKRGRRPALVPSELLKILNRLVEEEYAKEERPTVTAVLDAARQEVVKKNRVLPDADQIPNPTRVQMRRAIEAFDVERLLLRRRGKAVAHAKTRIYRAGPGALRLLERVEADHTQCDVVCVSSETHQPLGRPWITVLIDVASRMIIGAWISFHSPNANTVLRVVKQAIRRKEALIAKYQLTGEWPAHGVPLVLVMDNGMEFHSKALDAAAEDLGISLVYCPSREPRFKGVIERFMGTMNTGLIHMLPGTTFSSVADRGEYDSQARACLTIDEFRQLVFKWIVEVYSVTKHRGIDAAPLQRWKELEAVCPPQVPKRIEVLDTYLRPLEMRALSKKGIEINSLFYVSPELDEIRLANGLRAKDVRVGVRADPDDVGAIKVLHPEKDVYFTATCTRPDYASGMTLEQHKHLKKWAAKKYAQLGLLPGLLAAKEEIRQTVDGILNQGRRRATEASVATEEASSSRSRGKASAASSNAADKGARKGARGASKGGSKDTQHLVEEIVSRARAAADEAAATPPASSFDLEGDDFQPYDAIEAFGEREPELF